MPLACGRDGAIVYAVPRKLGYFDGRSVLEELPGLKGARTHARTRARTHACTHACTHAAHALGDLSPGGPLSGGSALIILDPNCRGHGLERPPLLNAPLHRHRGSLRGLDATHA